MCSPFPDCVGHYTILFPRCQVFSFLPRKVSRFPPGPPVLETAALPGCTSPRGENFSSGAMLSIFTDFYRLFTNRSMRSRPSLRSSWEQQQLSRRYPGRPKQLPGTAATPASRIRRYRHPGQRRKCPGRHKTPPPASDRAAPWPSAAQRRIPSGGHRFPPSGHNPYAAP